MAGDGNGILHTLRLAARAPIAPAAARRFALGWVLVILLATQVATGILLSFYYQASPRMAPESVRFVVRDVDWGWLIRGIHHWASHLFVAVGLLQLLRVLVAGSYRGARGGLWCGGLVLLGLVALQHVTGRLLPWDREALALTARLLDALGGVPLVGEPLVGFLRGGPQVGAATLGRAHASHVALVPFLFAVLLGLDLWFLARRRAERES